MAAKACSSSVGIAYRSNKLITITLTTLLLEIFLPVFLVYCCKKFLKTNEKSIFRPYNFIDTN